MHYGKFDPESRQDILIYECKSLFMVMFKTGWAHPARCFLSQSILSQNLFRSIFKVRIYPLPK